MDRGGRGGLSLNNEIAFFETVLFLHVLPCFTWWRSFLFKMKAFFLEFHYFCDKEQWIENRKEKKRKKSKIKKITDNKKTTEARRRFHPSKKLLRKGFASCSPITDYKFIILNTAIVKVQKRNFNLQALKD